MKRSADDRVLFPFEFYNILNHFICNNYDSKSKTSFVFIDDFVDALVNASDIDRDTLVSVVRLDSLTHKINKSGWSVKRTVKVVKEKLCTGFVLTDVEQNQINKKLEAVDRKSREKKFVDRVPQFWSLEYVVNWDGCDD